MKLQSKQDMACIQSVNIMNMRLSYFVSGGKYVHAHAFRVCFYKKYFIIILILTSKAIPIHKTVKKTLLFEAEIPPDCLVRSLAMTNC